MADMEKQIRQLQMDIAETGVRIRRYMLDKDLKIEDLQKLMLAHERWMELWEQCEKLASRQPATPTLSELQKQRLSLDWEVDLVQRALVSDKGLVAGMRTVVWLAVALVLLVLVYLYSHGVRSLDFAGFEPLGEWGPLKYVEVAYWSTFGVLCWLLFLAARYTLRRDFDPWYQPWYLSTALRAPFLSIVLMMVVLEGAEHYGEGTWIESNLMEEGNKSFFIAFMSFCLGLTSDDTAEIAGELSGGVIEFVRGAVQRFSGWLKSLIAVRAPDK